MIDINLGIDGFFSNLPEQVIKHPRLKFFILQVIFNQGGENVRSIIQRFFNRFKVTWANLIHHEVINEIKAGNKQRYQQYENSVPKLHRSSATE